MEPAAGSQENPSSPGSQDNPSPPPAEILHVAGGGEVKKGWTATLKFLIRSQVFLRTMHCKDCDTVLSALVPTCMYIQAIQIR